MKIGPRLLMEVMVVRVKNFTTKFCVKTPKHPVQTRKNMCFLDELGKLSYTVAFKLVLRRRIRTVIEKNDLTNTT